MNTIKLGEVHTFPNAAVNKEQALKILEEAAEVYSAWENYAADDESAEYNLACECADLITAVCNMMAALGIEDGSIYIEHVEAKNKKRGRYIAEQWQ